MATKSVSEIDQAKLALLTELASYRIDGLLAELGVRLRPSGKMLVGACPVHGGNKANAFNLYPDGYAQRGNWVCRSKSCQKIFQPTLIGFVRGVQSRNKLGWDYKCGHKKKLIPFMDSVRWLCQFCEQSWENLRPNVVELEKKQFVAQANTFSRRGAQDTIQGWTRAYTRARLTIPSPYFLGRGFSADVLNSFDVGDSKVTDPNHPMFERAVVPVLERNGGRVIGVTGRSIHERCEKCQVWHHDALPCPNEAQQASAHYCKWRNSSGFRRESHLYGFWKVQKAIREHGQVLLVEGPGEVWRAVEAGCAIPVGLFGIDLTDAQQVVLESSGAIEVVTALNADLAGKQGVVNIHKQLGRAFKLRNIEPPWPDLGAAQASEVRSWLKANKVVVQ